ncbi:MAG: AAA family ATPase [Candidatus Melainabacteria bacterium]|nr:AAA family ATPase [Candidatus Melainabacteria bacterium]
MDPSRYDDNLTRAFSICAGLMEKYPARLVSPEHLLLALLNQGSAPLTRALDRLKVNRRELTRRLTAYLYSTQEGFPVRPDQVDWADSTMAIFQRAGDLSEALGDRHIGVEHVLMAFTEAGATRACVLLKESGCGRQEAEDALSEKAGQKSAPGTGPGAPARPMLSGVLAKLCEDLSARAEEGALDPVIGREKEIGRMINILSRRSKNNPVLLGEAGVGKTALAEGLALRIARNEVPVSLRGLRVVSLDVGRLVAGTSLRGQFEERLNDLVEELVARSGSIILFIDELHLLVGAGATSGSAMDAGNILKPYLARGQIRCVGATTFSEYSRHIEKDPALARRFQPVLVKEPTLDEALSILRGLKEKLEVYHGISILDSALESAASMSHRYITDRRLPDKAIDLVDEAAARKSVEIDSPPPELTAIHAELHRLSLERASLARDNEKDSYERLQEIDRAIEELETKASAIRQDWSREIEGLSHITALKDKIEQVKQEVEELGRKGDPRRAGELVLEKLEPLKRLLAEAGGEAARENGREARVGEDEIAAVVSEWTGIPIGRLKADEAEALRALEKELEKRVKGQNAALEAVARSIRISRTDIGAPRRPVGTFLFLGPTGVGKTETARALADNLFNDPAALVRLDMSEYFDRYTVSRLIGASPGYIGSDEGGQLTEAVRKRPYCCVLFDEIEKAHSDVYNIFLQILDDGRLTDARGRTVDFTNTVIIMTTNTGAAEVLEALNGNVKESENGSETEESFGGGIDTLPEPVRRALLECFKPELLNRIDDIVIFEPLKIEDIEAIVRLQLAALSKRLLEKGLSLEPSARAVGWLANRGYDPLYGARPIKRAIKNYVEAPLSEFLLSGPPDGREIVLDLDDAGKLALKTQGTGRS